MVCNNETATYSCEVFGSGVNWCIDNNCTIDGSLPYTNYTAKLKPASGTFYSVLHVYVPLFYNNSLVKCCVVPGNNCSQVVTLRVHCPKNSTARTLSYFRMVGDFRVFFKSRSKPRNFRWPCTAPGEGRERKQPPNGQARYEATLYLAWLCQRIFSPVLEL